MYAFRRHSRRLLLPPGWVALGFLLLLGCQALLAHRRQVQQYGVMQLMMPAIKQDTAMARFITKDYDMPYRLLSELDAARKWHTVDYWGRFLTDADNARYIKAAVQLIKADSAHDGGVRIRLHEHATYANLVEVLGIMNICKQPRYFLDIRHQPTTLYAITNKYVPVKTSNYSLVGGCVLYDDVFIPTPPVPTWEQILSRDISSLWQKAWRLPTSLFIVLIALSFYRLARPRPSLR
jgi:hypothetical protein